MWIKPKSTSAVVSRGNMLISRVSRVNVGGDQKYLLILPWHRVKGWCPHPSMSTLREWGFFHFPTRYGTIKEKCDMINEIGSNCEWEPPEPMTISVAGYPLMVNRPLLLMWNGGGGCLCRVRDNPSGCKSIRVDRQERSQPGFIPQGMAALLIQEWDDDDIDIGQF